MEEGQSPGLPPSKAGPSTKPSTSNDSKINQLFKELHDSRHAEKQLKLKVAELVGRNVAMYDIYQEMKQKFDKVLERNKMLMRDNVSLYSKIRVLRLQLKELQTPKAQSSGLEALAEVAETMEETTEKEAPRPVEKRRGKGTKQKTPEPTEKRRGKRTKQEAPLPLERRRSKRK